MARSRPGAAAPLTPRSGLSSSFGRALRATVLIVILSCVTAQQTSIYEPLPLPVADYALAPPLVVGAAGGPDDSGNNDGNGVLTAASVPLLPSADDLPDGDIMEGASAWRCVCVHNVAMDKRRRERTRAPRAFASMMRIEKRKANTLNLQYPPANTTNTTQTRSEPQGGPGHPRPLHRDACAQCNGGRRAGKVRGKIARG